MTAIAAWRRTSEGRAARRLLGTASLAVAISCIFPPPAFAQWGGSVDVESDYRLRGYSLTDGDPAATGQLTYDDPSGIYLNVAGVARLRSADPQFMGVVANAGYARRLNRNVTLDGGVLRSQIRASGPYAEPYHYTEIYAGVGVGRVTGRVYYSPDYRHPGESTLYGELETGFEPAPNWRISGHVGVLTYLDHEPYPGAGTSTADWRIAVSRQVGRFDVHAALSSGWSSHYYAHDGYYYYKTQSKPVVTAGASLSF